MDDVQVHYNSPKPAQLKAHAYAQGNQIHLGPGQEKHLSHEAWHVVQQKQGRVQPTMQLQGVNINDNAGLEREADVMGRRVELTNDPYRKRNPAVFEISESILQGNFFHKKGAGNQEFLDSRDYYHHLSSTKNSDVQFNNEMSY